MVIPARQKRKPSIDYRLYPAPITHNSIREFSLIGGGFYFEVRLLLIYALLGI